MFTKQSKNTLILDILQILEKYSDVRHRLTQNDIILLLKSEFDMDVERKSIIRNISNLIETGRKSFIIRKTRSDGNFINFIKNTFEEAKKAAPSVILIDDLDRFENGDRDKVNGEAYIAIQSLIDEIKNDKVYVIATVNNETLLPDSLCRDGRFDKKIYM